MFYLLPFRLFDGCAGKRPKDVFVAELVSAPEGEQTQAGFFCLLDVFILRCSCLVQM